MGRGREGGMGRGKEGREERESNLMWGLESGRKN